MTLTLVPPSAAPRRLAATGLAVGRSPTPELAAEATRAAMKKARLDVAGGVLLIVSSDFAHDMAPVLTAVARCASSTNIIGCAAPGLFTEEDWITDTPGVAAMVLAPPCGWGTPDTAANPDEPLLALAAPNALDTTWLEAAGRRFGGVAGDATGSGPYRVWHNGRMAEQGRMEVSLAGLDVELLVAPGLRPLSPLLIADDVSGYELTAASGQTAYTSLRRHLPTMLRSGSPPLHQLVAVIAEPDEADHPKHTLGAGRYRLAPLIALNSARESITLATQLMPGQHFFWAWRDPLSAEGEMRGLLGNVDNDVHPAAGLLFCDTSRGASFFDGDDRDWALVRNRFPGMPLIGFYGNGELVPRQGHNLLLQYASVLALLSPRQDHVQS